jgi:hypothetical protein
MKKKRLLTVLLAATALISLSACQQLGLNGVTPGQSTDSAKVTQDKQFLASKEPIGFATGDLAVTVSTEKVKAGTLFNTQGMKDAATECGTTHPEGYFDGLFSKLQNADATIYKIKSNLSLDEEYDITVIPNTFGYADLAAFKKDFDVCAAGGNYPQTMDKNWLVLTGPCGAAYDNTPVLACANIQQVVDPTIKIK